MVQRQAAVARRERDAALAERRRAERVTTFLEEVIRRARPGEDGAQASLATAIGHATPYLDTAFVGDAELQAQVRTTVATTLGELQLVAQARPLLDSALAFYRRRDGARISQEHADALWSLSALLSFEGNRAGSDSILRLLLPVYAEPGYPPNQALKARAWLAENRATAGQLREALSMYDSVLARFQLATPKDSLFYATTLTNRGSTYVSLGDFARGSDDLLRGIALMDRVNAEETSTRASVMQPVAMALLFSRRLAEAESVARRALAIKRRASGEAARSQDGHARALGVILIARNKLDEADSVFSMILEDRGTRVPDTDPTIGFALAHRAMVRAMRGRLDGVRDEAREAVRLYARQYPSGSAPRSLIESVAGAALGYGLQAQWPEAHALMRGGLQGLERSLAPSHPRVTEARERLVAFERRSGMR
jgi:tetratricopeptide (TPR) repeat protein